MGTATVSAYESRPTLNIRQERNRRFTSLGFVEAVCQDTNPTTEELIPAYRVAGDGFMGRMRRLFIVLDDDEAVKQPGKAGNQKKKKRHASGEGSSGSSGSKKKPLPATQ
jgi:hypothetical protein